MSKSQKQKIVIRVLALVIALIMTVGLFVSFFQTRAMDKQISEWEQQATATPVAD